MKVEVKDAEKSQKELNVEVPIEKFNEIYDEELKKLVPTVKIPGFRKGKAPKSIVEREYSHKVRVDALEKVINKSVYEAITSEGIIPLNTPNVTDVNFEEDKPISFKVFVDVFPEVNVEKYKGYTFEKEKHIIKEKDVDDALDKLIENNTSFEPAEDKSVEKGDMVVIDFNGTIDGEPFEGGSASDYSIVVGSNTFLVEFEDGLVGMKAGDTKNIEVRFPDNYSSDLAGKMANFAVTVKEVKQKIVPELNDEFAKDVDDNCETLDDLRKIIKEDLEKEVEQIAKEQLYDKIIEKLIEENPFDVPETIIGEQAGRLADQAFQQYMHMYGVNPEQLGLTKEQMKEDFRERAELQVKSAIVLNKLAEIGEISVSDEELEEKIKEIAGKLKRDVEEYKKDLGRQGGKEGLRNNILTDKIFDFLSEHNEIIVKEIDPDEVAAKETQSDSNEEKKDNLGDE